MGLGHPLLPDIFPEQRGLFVTASAAFLLLLQDRKKEFVSEQVLRLKELQCGHEPMIVWIPLLLTIHWPPQPPPVLLHAQPPHCKHTCMTATVKPEKHLPATKPQNFRSYEYLPFPHG